MIIDLIKAREAARIGARMLRPLRTERTIRNTAKEFAEAWWDENRSDAFRAMWPDQRGYVIICWPYFYKVAREHLTGMLGKSAVSDIMKKRIAAAIFEDREKCS